MELNEQESIIAFSQAFLEWERTTQQQGLEKGLEKGLEQGLEKGLEQGLEKGLEQGLERERSLVMRQLNRKVGDLSPAVITSIESLSFEQTERLGETLLDFERLEDLMTWLKQVNS